MPNGSVLIVGDGVGLADALAIRLQRSGIEAMAVQGEVDSVLADRLGDRDWSAVVVLAHEDARALRLTLLCARLRPDLPLWVSLFDRSIMHQFHEIAPSVHVVETADMAAAELAERCMAVFGPDAKPRHAASGLRIVDDALRLMVIAGCALLAVLVVQVIITMAALHDGFVDAVYYSTRSVATVADVPRAAGSAAWFKLSSTIVTVVSVVLLAVFTAALVRRLSRPRLTTLLGRRRAVARGHVVVIGFGQVGFRLAQTLIRQDVAVIAVERDVDAPCVRLARRAGIPVAVGRGDDRELLELVGIRGCAAVAAVTSDDLVNVSVGLAASDLRPGVPLVLRLGDGDVAAETESLLHLGAVCDIHGLVASRLAATVAQQVATAVSG